MIDLIDFGGSYISLGAIRAVHNETDYDPDRLAMVETGNVLIDYGAPMPLAFEGDAESVMMLIRQWVDAH
jgi:hypothetical protein